MKPTNVDLLKRAVDALRDAADLIEQAAKPPKPTR
jgi:hypothetical protein